MSQQQATNQAHKSDEDDGILLQYASTHSSTPDSQQSAYHLSLPAIQTRGQPMHHSQTPNQSHSGRSPVRFDYPIYGLYLMPVSICLDPSPTQVSLEQYAIIPGPVRSATPRSGMRMPMVYTTNPMSHTRPLSVSSSTNNHGLPTPSPPVKKYNCTLCAMSFERRFDLKRHMHSHSDHKEFICSRCDKALARNDSLQRHQATCKGRKPA